MECDANVNNLARHNKDSFEWVSEHSGITGDDNADELARKGSETISISPDPI